MLFRTALLLFAWGALVMLTGGVDARLGGLDIKSRDPFRAFAISAALVLYLATFARADLIRLTEQLAEPFGRFAPLLAGGLAAALAIHGVYFGSFSVGGADSYGYVNQAYDWAAGALPAPHPIPLTLPFPGSDEMQVPLGYRVGQQPHTMVPTYAPGLPMLMAVTLIAGACGPFFVVPLSAIAFIWFTYRLGERAAGPRNGLLAALLAASSPVVLYQALWPMSDVPAGAAWTAAACVALNDRRRSAAAAGVLTALGLLIRPNLVPLAIVPFAQVVLVTRGRERLVRAAVFAIAPALVVVLIAVLNTMWYGGPQNSGYGAAAEIYLRANIWPNVKLYASWFRESETLGVLLAIVPLLPFSMRKANRAVVLLCAAMVVATFACYASYSQFEVWWYLRFLIPAGGAIAVLAATGMTTIARAFPQPFGRIAVIGLIGMALALRLSFAHAKLSFGPLQISERRYVDIGEFVDENLPSNAVLFSSQHSGSLRFYSGRHTLRFDWVRPEWARDVVPGIERAGLHPYLVIDDFEAPEVRRQFGLPADSPFTWPVRARMRELGGLTVYDMASSPEATTPVALEPGSKHRCAPRR